VSSAIPPEEEGTLFLRRIFTFRSTVLHGFARQKIGNPNVCVCVCVGGGVEMFVSKIKFVGHFIEVAPVSRDRTPVKREIGVANHNYTSQ
jgi:hypothetical protein